MAHGMQLEVEVGHNRLEVVEEVEVVEVEVVDSDEVDGKVDDGRRIARRCICSSECAQKRGNLYARGGVYDDIFYDDGEVYEDACDGGEEQGPRCRDRDHELRTLEPPHCPLQGELGEEEQEELEGLSVVPGPTLKHEMRTFISQHLVRRAGR